MNTTVIVANIKLVRIELHVLLSFLLFGFVWAVTLVSVTVNRIPICNHNPPQACVQVSITAFHTLRCMAFHNGTVVRAGNYLERLQEVIKGKFWKNNNDLASKMQYK